MAFDPNLDEEKFLDTVEFDGTKISVGIFSYNDGEPKMQLTRVKVNAEGKESFAKLGRLTKEEAEKIIPLMQQAIEKM